MKSFVGYEWFAGIGNFNQLIRKIREQVLQQKTARQVLQTLVRMGNIPVMRDIAFKELFCFFNLPNTQPGVIVNLMLIKNWH